MRKINWLMIPICVVMMTLGSYSARASESAPGNFSLRRQIATIIFSGLGGAVLGISTLSFYGQPQDHISNISTGFALGIIAGTAVVSYQAANSSLDARSQMPEIEAPRAQAPVAPPILAYSFSF